MIDPSVSAPGSKPIARAGWPKSPLSSIPSFKAALAGSVARTQIPDNIVYLRTTCVSAYLYVVAAKAAVATFGAPTQGSTAKMHERMGDQAPLGVFAIDRPALRLNKAQTPYRGEVSGQASRSISAGHSQRPLDDRALAVVP